MEFLGALELAFLGSLFVMTFFLAKALLYRSAVGAQHLSAFER